MYPPPPPPEMLCESCGKFIGRGNACPHCGAKKHKRVRQRTLIVCAVILLLIGILYLPLANIYSIVPITKIADLTEEDSFNYIKIKGFVYSAPTFEPDKYYNNTTGIIRFRVTDGTGNITVKAYSLVSKVLIAEGRIPAFGDDVSAEGVAIVGESYVLLKLTKAAHLQIEKRIYSAVPISDIASADASFYKKGTKVKITGKIKSLNRAYEKTFALFFDVCDASGNKVTVFIPKDVILLTGGFKAVSLQNLKEGGNVTVCGALEWYEPKEGMGRWEIIPPSVEKIVVEL